MLENTNKITLLNMVSTIILQGLAFFSGPIFSSLLDTNNYGIASVYLTWVNISSIVFSLQAACTISVARIYFPLEDQPKYQSSVLGLATVAYSCFSIVTILVVSFLSKILNIEISMVLFGLAHGWGMYCVSFMNSKYTYEFNAGKNFILSVTTSVLIIGLSIFLIKLYPDETNYWGRIIGQSVVYISIGLIIFIIIMKEGRTFVNKEYWKFTLPIAIPTIFHHLANIVLNQGDKLMLQTMMGNSATGIYALSCTFGTVLHVVWGSFNNSWVPFYYEYTRLNRIDKMKEHARNYIELFTIVAMGFILLSREVFHLYAKASFWGGTDLIPLFAIGHYFVFLYSFPVNYEFYNKKTNIISIGTIFAAICNIGLNYILIELLGMIGAVIATVIAHALQFLFHYISAKRINPGQFPFRISDFTPGLLAVSLTCVVFWFTRELWIIRWALAAVIGTYILIKIIKRKEIF